MDDIFITPVEEPEELFPVIEGYTTPDPYEKVVEEVENKKHVARLKRLLKKQKKKKLTKRQSQVLFVIRMYQFKYLATPSNRKVGEILSVHPTYVRACIKSLEEKGWLEKIIDPSNPMRNIVAFPKDIIFPFWDETQFPPEVFNPTTMRNKNKHIIKKYQSSI